MKIETVKLGWLLKNFWCGFIIIWFLLGWRRPVFRTSLYKNLHSEKEDFIGLETAIVNVIFGKSRKFWAGTALRCRYVLCPFIWNLGGNNCQDQNYSWVELDILRTKFIMWKKYIIIIVIETWYDVDCRMPPVQPYPNQNVECKYILSVICIYTAIIYFIRRKYTFIRRYFNNFYSLHKT